MSRDPENNPAQVYLWATGIIAQVGCLLTVIAGGAVLLGLLLDRLLGTEPIFIFVLLLGSIPLNLWAIYQYTRYKTRNLQTTSQKEESIRND